MLTEEQKKFRLYKITSSIAAACLGLDPFKSPVRAWEEIMGLYSFAGNSKTRVGDLLEKPCLFWAAEQPPFKDLTLRTALDGQMPVWNPETPWMCDLVDGTLETFESPPAPPIGQAYCEDGTYPHDGITYVLDAKTCDTKNPRTARLWGREMSDKVPVQYKIQAHIHMIHYPTAKACLIPVFKSIPFGFHMYQINKDISYEKYLVERLRKWHEDYVASGSPPDEEPEEKRIYAK